MIFFSKYFFKFWLCFLQLRNNGAQNINIYNLENALVLGINA